MSEKVFTYSFQDELNGGGGPEDSNEIQERATFNAEIFFNVLLPPIIFNAGYGMHRKHFFDNFGAIVLFALLGTTVSAFVVGAITYLFSLFIVEKVRLLDALYFGAVISATDPVTMLTIFHVSCQHCKEF